MPATHVRCCDKEMTIAEALAHVATGNNRCHWTYELLAAMLDAQTQHPSNRDGTRISTTVLTHKCLRQLTFERQVDHSVELDNLWAMFRGTQFHGQLEPYAKPGSYAEARFYVDDLGVQIPEVAKGLPDDDRSFSGSPDLVDPKLGILYDYKRTKEVPRFNRVWPDHAAQNNINRWLVEHADRVSIPAWPESLRPDAIEDDGRASFSMDREDVRAFFVPMDWQRLTIVYVDDKGPKPIDCTKSIRIPTKTTGGTKPALVPDIWTDAECEAYIGPHYIAARTALLEGIAPVPRGWEHQSHALCVRCPMRALCAACEHEGR